MKVERLRVLPNLLAVIALVMASFGTVYADTRPYFKVFGGDVMTGGNFASSTACDTSTSGGYQDPNTTPTDNRRGGILAFVNSSKGGAAGQYGVLSIGQIETNSGSSYGFYSGGDLASMTRLTFANTSGGGLFDGANRQPASCISDYFSERGNTQALSTSGDTINTAAIGNGKYYFKPSAGGAGAVISSPITVNAGQFTTIYIDGTININAPITFASSAGYTVNNAPKFAIVAKGDILISKNVSRLDGVYIAQAGTAVGSMPNSGSIWTCTDPTNVNNNKDSLWLGANCQTRLTINGAVIANQINFTRVKGDTAAAPAGEDASCAAAAVARNADASGVGCDNIAEVINYIPEMVLGGTIIGETSTGTTGAPAQSVQSLPPSF
jgi:hypothetical protein